MIDSATILISIYSDLLLCTEFDLEPVNLFLFPNFVCNMC